MGRTWRSSARASRASSRSTTRTAPAGSSSCSDAEPSDAAKAADAIAQAWPDAHDGLLARTYGPPGLEDDIAFCAQVSVLDVVPRLSRMVDGAAEISLDAELLGNVRSVPGDTVHVRYMVDDVEAAIAFYTTHFGFELLTDSGACVRRRAARKPPAAPQRAASSAARPMPDGRQPEPGGWNRIHLLVDDLAAEVERLRAAGLSFRNDIVKGPGGSQILSTTRRAIRSSSSSHGT